jgi:hypothetical protein
VIVIEDDGVVKALVLNRKQRTSILRSLNTTRASGGKNSLSVTRLEATFSQSVILANNSSAPARYLAGGDLAGSDRQRRTSFSSSSRMGCSGNSVRSCSKRAASDKRGISKGITCGKIEKRRSKTEALRGHTSAIAVSLKMLMLDGTSFSSGAVVKAA